MALEPEHNLTLDGRDPDRVPADVKQRSSLTGGIVEDLQLQSGLANNIPKISSFHTGQWHWTFW